jgi:hypothetical protein
VADAFRRFRAAHETAFDWARACVGTALTPRLEAQAADRRAQAEEAASLALLLQERGLGGRGEDLAARLERWQRERGGRAEASRKLAQRWAASAARLAGRASGPEVPLGVLLAEAFPDRIARARGASGEEWLASGGRGYRLDPASSLSRAAWLVIGDAQGEAGSTPPSETPLMSLVSGPVAEAGTWALVGIASERIGSQMAVGIDSSTLSRSWTLPLGDGVHRDGPIEPVAWADLLGTPRRQWLIAAPDGSVTVAWADGRVVDRYQHGKPLVGIGGYRQGERGHMVLATREGLEAYAVTDVALD